MGIAYFIPRFSWPSSAPPPETPTTGRHGITTGGGGRNRDQLGDKVSLPAALPEEMLAILFDPQTSGGLLMAVPPEAAGPLVDRLRADGSPAAVIGEVREGAGLAVKA